MSTDILQGLLCALGVSWPDLCPPSGFLLGPGQRPPQAPAPGRDVLPGPAGQRRPLACPRSPGQQLPAVPVSTACRVGITCSWDASRHVQAVPWGLARGCQACHRFTPARTRTQEEVGWRLQSCGVPGAAALPLASPETGDSRGLGERTTLGTDGAPSSALRWESPSPQAQGAIPVPGPGLLPQPGRWGGPDGRALPGQAPEAEGCTPRPSGPCSSSPDPGSPSGGAAQCRAPAVSHRVNGQIPETGSSFFLNRAAFWAVWGDLRPGGTSSLCRRHNTTCATAREPRGTALVVGSAVVGCGAGI